MDWRLSNEERESRYRQCGRDIQQLLKWLQGRSSKVEEIKAVKLLRRVFEEQFEVVGKEIYATRKRPSRTVQNPHDPDAHYADKGKKQWVGSHPDLAPSPYIATALPPPRSQDRQRDARYPRS